jgi:uncharacterized protein involved in copper resistance
MSSPVYDKISNPVTSNLGALGIQGMALYNFEAEATAYIGENGQTAARFEGDYDILLTNRLICSRPPKSIFTEK